MSGHLPDLRSAGKILEGFGGGSTLRPTVSHGGTAAIVVGEAETGTLTGWTTMPSVVPLFLSELNPEFAILGSRPLLVHMAESGSDRPSFRRDFLFEMLPSGYSLAGNTVFEGVRRVAKFDAVVVDARRATTAPHPLSIGGLQNRSLDRAASEYGEIIRDVVSRRPVQQRLFRLSGGKDSRLVAAAMIGHRELVAVTDGDAGSGESVIAAEVARICGFDHVIRPTRDHSKPLCEAAEYYNLLSEGLTSHDPRKYAEVLTFGASSELVTGQGELHKGGYARASGGERNPLGLVAARLFDRSLVSDGILGPARSLLNDWQEVRRAVFTEKKSSLYWSYVDFRLGDWYMNRYMQWDGRHHLHMPLLDDRVSRFLATVPLDQKVREHLLHATVQYLSGELAMLPFYKDAWLVPNLTSPLAPPEEIAGIKNNRPSVQAIPRRRQAPTPQHLAADYILSSSACADVREAVSGDMWEQLQSFALKKGATSFWTDATSNRKRKENFLFRLFMAVSLYDRSWVRPY